MFHLSFHIYFFIFVWERLNFFSWLQRVTVISLWQSYSYLFHAVKHELCWNGCFWEFRVSLFFSQVGWLWEKMCRIAVKAGRLSGWVVVRLPLTCLISQCCCEWWEKCILCPVDVRTECPFSFVYVLLQEESVVTVVDGGIFLSRCLAVALPCRHWRSRVL